MTLPELIPLPPSRHQMMQIAIGGLYRPGRRWTIPEMDLMKHVLAHVEAESEVEIVVKYFNALPGHEKKYFPNSVWRLLENWQQVLDKAYLSKQVTAAPLSPNLQHVVWEKQLVRVEEAMRKLKASCWFDDHWDSENAKLEYRGHRECQKLLKQKLGFTI
jgi:hypothetical protein